VVTGVPYTQTQDTTQATVAASDPTDCVGPRDSVWYSFTPNAAGRYVISTEGSDYDTSLAVYTGTPGALSLVACSNDFADVTAVVGLQATAGTRYLVMVGQCCGGSPGDVGIGGTLAFSVTKWVAASISAVTVDSPLRVTSVGLVQASGSITCTGVAGFGIDGTLTQGKGSRLVWGPFSAFGRCTGASTRWATTLGSVTDLIFRNGSATYAVNADACDIFACVNASRQGKVRLKMAHA